VSRSPDIFVISFQTAEGTGCEAAAPPLGVAVDPAHPNLREAAVTLYFLLFLEILLAVAVVNACVRYA
jgi:hypothetical protein